MKDKSKHSNNRRKFLSDSVKLAAGAALVPHFNIVRPDILRANKLNVACVGIGRMGNAAVEAAMQENLIAVCDVDWRNKKKLWGSRSPVKNHKRNPQARKFIDFREMYSNLSDQIDVVLISTPDHTHFPITMEALNRDLPVFVQKPLAHNIWQVRTLQMAAERTGVATVMGNQGHTWEGARQIKEWFDAGILGEVTEVHCWTDRPCLPWFVDLQKLDLQPQKVPKDLHWELWQGPVPDSSYYPHMAPMEWRGWWKYGVGALGDIGCHTMDAPYWALQLTQPTAVDVELAGPAHKDFTVFGAHVTFHFPARGAMPPVKLHWWEGTMRPDPLPGMESMPTNGMYMKGAKETLYHEDMRPGRPILWPESRMAAYEKEMAEKTIPRVEGGPFRELFRAVKGDGPKPGSHFGYSGPLTEMVLLGTMAIRSGQRIEWDPKQMKVTNLAAANDWVKEPVREGWKYGEEYWKTK